ARVKRTDDPCGEARAAISTRHLGEGASCQAVKDRVGWRALDQPLISDQRLRIGEQSGSDGRTQRVEECVAEARPVDGGAQSSSDRGVEGALDQSGEGEVVANPDK